VNIATTCESLDARCFSVGIKMSR